MAAENAGTAPLLFRAAADRTDLFRPRSAPATQHPQRDVVVHGLRLRYIDVLPEDGDPEGPPLLLIHGLSSRIEEYDALLPHVTRGRRVIVPDLPGSGYSDKPVRDYSLRFIEDTLLGFLDALNVRRAHLGGGSLGGNLVLRLAHREPERFDRLAAWAPAGSWEPMWFKAWLARLAKRFGFLFWPSLWVQSRFWFRRDWAGRTRALAEAWAYYREVYSEGFHRMYWDLGADQVAQSLFRHAPSIQHPTYVAYGDQDKALDMDRGVQRLAALLPRATLRVFEGARHSLASEVPAQLGADVHRFLRGASTG